MTQPTSDPRVSIVLATHNGGRFLAESVRSCIEQTFEDWELIVVDDASDDGVTPELARSLCATDDRITLVALSQNRGLPGALNAGFERARGSYLTWTSDDNCYRPEALAWLTAVLDARRDVDVVYSDYSTFDDDGTMIGKVELPDLDALADGNAVGACFLYRRVVHDQLDGYNEDRFLVEDYEFWLRASMAFRFEHLRQDLYLYRLHASSLTSTRKAAIVDAIERTRAEHLPHLDWLSRRRRARTHLALARSALAKRQWRDSARELGRGALATLQRRDPHH